MSRIVELFRFEKGVILDGTVGQGGHAEQILQANSNVFLVCVDRDESALENAKKRLSMFSDRTTFVKSSFADLKGIQNIVGEKFVGILLDLGVSLDQLKDKKRGFSFLARAPLDMRYDLSDKTTAYDIVNHWSEEELEKIFREYADISQSKRVANAIVSARKKKPIETTDELAEIVAKVIRSKRIHPATKVFMAIRMAVNQELEQLEKFLREFPSHLERKGTVAVISFHSVEDRLVKRYFSKYAKEGFLDKGEKIEFELVYKKPCVPEREEILENPRARSAKLRAIRKID